MRAFNHEASIYQVVTPYNDYNGGEGNHNHEINIVARTCGCGKVWSNHAMGIYGSNVRKALGHFMRAFNHEAGISSSYPIQ